MQSGVEVDNENGKIVGTLKYVDDYTGFSGDPAEQVGNYLALKVSAEEGATVTVELVGGTSGPKELDEDMNFVTRITSTTQEIKVTETLSEQTVEETLNLGGLILEEEEVSPDPEVSE